MKHFLVGTAVISAMFTLSLAATPAKQGYHERLQSVLTPATALPALFTEKLYTEQDTKLLTLVSSLLTSYGPLTHS